MTSNMSEPTEPLQKIIGLYAITTRDRTNGYSRSVTLCLPLTFGEVTNEIAHSINTALRLDVSPKVLENVKALNNSSDEAEALALTASSTKYTPLREAANYRAAARNLASDALIDTLFDQLSDDGLSTTWRIEALMPRIVEDEAWLEKQMVL